MNKLMAVMLTGFLAFGCVSAAMASDAQNNTMKILASDALAADQGATENTDEPAADQGTTKNDGQPVTGQGAAESADAQKPSAVRADSQKDNAAPSNFSGVRNGVYYKNGAPAVARKSYYIIYKHHVYKVSKTGSCKKDTVSGSGTHKRIISKKCYSINNKTAKPKLYSGIYKGKCYKKGVIASGWQKIGKKKYYCSKNGTVAKGRKKISGKYFYFKRTGVLATKDTKEKSATYYINQKGNLEAYKKGKTYYKPNGKKMTEVETADYTTLRTARGIVGQITSSKMTKEEKLKKCFDWVIKKQYRRYRIPFAANEPAWISLYANDHFVRAGGDCHSDAAAFGYLARAIGYKDVYICIDAKLKNSNHHAWTRIGNRYYDPLFAEAKSYKQYWAASKYPLRAVEQFAIAEGYQ